MNGTTNTVCVFRKRLLAYSETFIADQGQLLPNYRAVYAGYQQDASGISLIEDSARLLLEDYSAFPGLAKLRLRLGLATDRRWLAALRESTASLIHAHFLSDGIDACLLAEQLDLPVVTTVHGHDITKSEKPARFFKDSRYLFERVDRVVAVSDFIARQALARGCPEHKLVQHYIGIDLERFTRAKQESDLPSLLFVGRLVEKKGCTYLLQAMVQLKARFPDLRLTLVGDGDLRDALRQEALSLGLDVDFVGAESAEQIRTRMSASWLFVAPSITAASGDAEGLGMVFLEAQALQTPVVSFRSGGVVEAVEDGVSGLLCAEKDVAALADNIATLLEDRNLRQQLGAQGRERVERHFDVRKQCAKLELIYAKLH